MRGNSVNPVNPIGQFFQPVSPENHTDGVVMYFFKVMWLRKSNDSKFHDNTLDILKSNTPFKNL
ncbi:hypothetical protein BpHYR1_004324 [Brachionus plicatilis]|uniref:Uncharacterized protein n=1 Tax=Brachionus plicatilis TaxID=10195 RepID=A0A3M7SDW1_BRAPC|nr:hypothetical protein BpHYR1_004324 [Brachionus plicatilis]